MKRYSMLNRRVSPSIVSKFSSQDKYDIMYKYLVDKKLLKDIYEYYRGRGVGLEYFLRLPSALIEDKELMDRILKRVMSKTRYEEYKGTSICMGSKEESYWLSEDEMIYKGVNVKDLSKSEQIIYFSKPRKTNNYGRE